MKKRRGRKSKLTFKEKVDNVKVCKDGPGKVFILPRGMTNEEYTHWRVGNRAYLRNLKKQES